MIKKRKRKKKDRQEREKKKKKNGNTTPKNKRRGKKEWVKWKEEPTQENSLWQGQVSPLGMFLDDFFR